MAKTVFTNGCFDIIHAGHVDLLKRASELGDRLIVGINSDESVRAIKGSPRPFVGQTERAAVLLGLESVDKVVIFDEATPERIIKEIKPDVLVKGGDWRVSEIVGADFVQENGGEVHSLPLVEGHSSSSIVERITASAYSNDPRMHESGTAPAAEAEFELSIARASVEEHLETFERINRESIGAIEECGKIITDAILNGNKVMFCGNGGSAADSQHLATEFVGRFEAERRALPAIALTTDTSALTAIANDYGYERVFVRQIEALAKEGDVLVGISTSGTSPNVVAGVMKARELGCRTIGLTGAKGKKLASLCDAAVLVPSERVSRIQEGHITIGQIWCEIVDRAVQ